MCEKILVIQIMVGTICSSYIDKPHRRHLNRKTFVAGDRFKWTRYNYGTSYSREEYGFPHWSNRDEYLKAIAIWGSPKDYYKTYRKWSGEPPRFNLKLLLRVFFESRLSQGIQLKFRLYRSKNSWV